MNNISKNKFNVGSHVWVVHYSETDNELHIFDDKIVSISWVYTTRTLSYEKRYELFKDCNDYNEDELVLFHDVSGLNKKINDTINKIKEMGGIDVKKIYKEKTNE